MADTAGNWCLIESDPGVFTELIEKFGKHLYFLHGDGTKLAQGTHFRSNT